MDINESSREEGEVEGDDELTPREYQSILLRIAIEKNTILFLPTGSGKTYVAVMLIKTMSKELHQPLSEGGKRSFFMVNTVALVDQQAKYIERHAALKVGRYSGDMNVDFWSKETWLKELNKYQAIVMTCQIFLNILHHHVIKLEDVNLLIFDECHHGVSDHSMRQVMQLFENIPEDKQPRVLGLTATLLNSNCKPHKVAEEVKNLETTYRSKVATVDDMSKVQGFSTNPIEKMCCYQEMPKLSVMTEVEAIIKKLQNQVMDLTMDSGDFEYNRHSAEFGRNLKDQRKINKKIRNILEDVWIHIATLGIYGGSIAALKHDIQLRRIRNKAEDQQTRIAYIVFINALEMIRKLLEDCMTDCSRRTRIYKYSSPKLLTLFEVLRRLKPKKDGVEEEDNTRGIVFVERRFSAKVIYLILKDLRECDDDFKFINPDFVVGFQNNPFNNTREGALEKKWNQEAMYRFNRGHSNLLVSSDVLEEGIDVQQCNFVVRFDEPKSYCSYIQSKGRARKKSSLFVMLLSLENQEKSKAKIQSYKDIEYQLKVLLVGQNDNRAAHSGQNSLDSSREEQVYAVDGIVTMVSAISLVNRYCSLLPQDKFTTLAPNWYIKQISNGYQCFLELPMNSPLRDTIEGEVMQSQRNAKRSVALKTCEQLHKVGELDDNLLPRTHASVLIDSDELFLMYENESLEKDQPLPGTKKRKRFYKRKFPDALSNCKPTESRKCYLHCINMKPVYPAPASDDSRKLAFYELLDSDQSFGIVCSKKLPQICQFPIFMNVGELQINIQSNCRVMSIEENRLNMLQQFNTFVFFDVLKLCKQFMIVDLDDEENSYWMVPTKLGANGILEIDWKVVKDHQVMTNFTPMSEDVRKDLDIKKEKYHRKVVTPWYRGLQPEQMYIVTEVCDNLTALSKFPSKEHGSFKDYFLDKYKLNVMQPNQPMLEVKAISNKINCIKPRGKQVSHGTSKRKRQELQEDFEEHLVPELCRQYTFPASLWLKATCLPTILHRLHHLLLAEELRYQIGEDLKLNTDNGREWEPMPLDTNSIKEETEKHHLAPPSPWTTDGTSKSSKTSKTKLYPWGDEIEPIDIDREHPEDITLMDIQYYEDFIAKPLSENPTLSKLQGNSNGDSFPRSTNSPFSNCSEVPAERHFVPIAILNKSIEDVGPEQYEIYQALTTLSGNDILNLERLETLGDSFLKFASSLFLFIRYPKVDEGLLTQIKGKMVGNRNLFYCGKGRRIPQIMKVHDFAPRCDWCPPGVCVQRQLQQVLRDASLCPTVLYELNIPENEQRSGKLSSETLDIIQEKILSCEQDLSAQSSMESFIGLQSVVDKNIADCVEALIGAFLRTYGISGAVQILGWLKILPPDLANASWLFDSNVPSAFLSPDIEKRKDIDFHLANTQELENCLGYHFKDRSFLLQALSHASYDQNRITDCYQRLEFLGDAILDFLITCHIYEKCGNLSPGELTDLRSALVNNITFATLAVRNNFHKYYKFNSSKLFDKVDAFVIFQEERNHEVNEDVLILLEEVDCGHMAESVDVPKVLGDLFESLAGAIYLDSGKSLQEVWRVFYNLMAKEIRMFSECIPISPIRMLYEKCQPPPFFHQTVCVKDSEKVMVQLDVTVKADRRSYFGFGENKFHAKRAAAKLALKDLP